MRAIIIARIFFVYKLALKYFTIIIIPMSNRQFSSETVRTFRPVSDTTSYFSKLTAEKEQKIRAEINQQVRTEANAVIHKIVTEKDNEINLLKTALDKKDNIIKLIQQEAEIHKQQNTIPINGKSADIIDQLASAAAEDSNTFIYELFNIIKRGSSDTEFASKDQEKIRKIVLSWKCFFEEYKWKSNYISKKIIQLLKETEGML